MPQSEVFTEAEVLNPGPLGDPDIRLLAFELQEAISTPFELRVELISSKSDLDTGALIGKSLVVKMTLPSGQARHLNGRIASAALLGSFRATAFRYDAVVRPGLWFLTHTRRSRVFSNQDAVAIVKSVLASSQSLGVSVDSKVTKTCATRPYCVQYQESDFDFVSRLLEEEGIYYFFKHSSNAHSMVLADAPEAHTALIASASMDYLPGASKAATNAEAILSWQCRDHVGPAKFELRAFDFERSTTSLNVTSQASAKGPDSLQVEVFPEGYLFEGADKGADKGPPTQQAQRFADVMAAQRNASARQVEGETDAGAMACGYTFEVSKLTVSAQNGKYLVTRTLTSFRQSLGQRDAASADTYSCRFSALKSEVPFRPAAVTPKPRMYGPHTAIVVGTGEVDPDAYGRVKVKFHWGPSSAQTSCWARVSHPWASKGFGMVALPRVGDEVVVDFIDGDPDHPLITGRVYNAQSMPPYELPAQKTVTGIRTRSSEGGEASNFNELRFDDKKGSEYVWLQAEKIFHRKVKNDAFDDVGQDQFVKIARDRMEDLGRDLHVKIGQHLIQKVAGDAQVDIGNDTIVNIGKQLNATVGTDLLAKVGGKAQVDVATNLAVNVGSNTALTTGSNLDISAGQNLASSAGANLDMKGAVNVTMEAGAKVDVKAGANMSLEATAQMSVKGLTISIGAATMITLKAGPSTITLGPSGVTIDGPLVKINSGGGGGDASSAGSATDAQKAEKAQPAAPKAPTAPTAQQDPIQ